VFGSRSIAITQDSFIITGNYNIAISAAENIEFTKFYKDLEQVWHLDFSIPGYNHVINGIFLTLDNRFLIYGFRAISGEQGNGIPFITKFDKNGIPTNLVDSYVISKMITYPNPSSRELNFVLDGVNGKADLRIYDINGRNVFVQSGITEGHTTIDLSGLLAGIYLYKIYQGSKVLGNGKWGEGMM
jgi:hypothetical protein